MLSSQQKVHQTTNTEMLDHTPGFRMKQPSNIYGVHNDQRRPSNQNFIPSVHVSPNIQAIRQSSLTPKASLFQSLAGGYDLETISKLNNAV